MSRFTIRPTVWAGVVAVSMAAWAGVGWAAGVGPHLHLRHAVHQAKLYAEHDLKRLERAI